MEPVEIKKSLAGSGKKGHSSDEDSINYTFDDIDPLTSFVFYVSAEGDDLNSGEKDYPFKTVQKALSVLKNSFTNDASKTEGYVLILSDLELEEGIKIDEYRFDQLATGVVNLTIAGYGKIRTLDGKADNRIMNIAYTEGSVTVSNLAIKNGYSKTEGGGGIYVSSFAPADSFTNKILINNCKFTQITSELEGKGTALYLKTGYSVSVVNCVFSENKFTASSGSAGAAVIEITNQSGGTSRDTTLKNCKITNNELDGSGLAASDFNFGFVINSSKTVYLDNIMISDNKVTGITAADLNNLAALSPSNNLSITGVNTIYNNLINSKQRNILLKNRYLLVSGNLTGSTIGVFWNGPAPSVTSPAEFTLSYNYNNSLSPSAIFISDCDYGIGYNSAESEAAFVLSGGSITNPLGMTFTFTVSPLSITAGSSALLSVTPIVKNSSGSDITASVVNDIVWRLSLMSGSTQVAASNTNTLELSAQQTMPDSYILNVEATLNGITYDDNAQIVCE